MAEAAVGIAGLTGAEGNEPVRSGQVGKSEGLVDLVAAVLDPVQGGVEQHQHVVVLEQDVRAPLPVEVAAVLIQTLHCFRHLTRPVPRQRLGPVDAQVQGHLLAGAQRAHGVRPGEVGGQVVEASGHLPPPLPVLVKGDRRQRAQDTALAAPHRRIPQGGDVLPHLLGQLLERHPQHRSRPRGELVLLAVLVPAVLLVVVPRRELAVAGEGAQTAAHALRGLFRSGQGVVDDLQFVGELLGAQQRAGLGEQGGTRVCAGVLGGQDHGAVVVRQPVDDRGHHPRDDHRIGEGFLHVQPVDDQDAGGRLHELLELVGEPAVLVQELGGHQGGEGLLIGHPLAQIVGLPVQAPYGRQASHRCAGRGDAHLPLLHSLRGRVQQRVGVVKVERQLGEVRPRCRRIRLSAQRAPSAPFPAPPPTAAPLQRSGRTPSLLAKRAPRTP
ncbi:hypothetical protein RKD19_000073 [Streptomyces canus]